MSEPILKTPDEWCELLGTTLLDRDGWTSSSDPLFLRSWFYPITQQEFEQRASFCRQYVRVPEQSGPPVVGVPAIPIPVDIGHGYKAVPFLSVTLNGIFLSAIAEGTKYEDGVAVLDPATGRALKGENNQVYLYESVEAAANDVKTLVAVSAPDPLVIEGHKLDRQFYFAQPPDLDADLAGYQDELSTVKLERDAAISRINAALLPLRELEGKHVRANAAVGRPQEHSPTLRLVRQAINILCPSTAPTHTNP